MSATFKIAKKIYTQNDLRRMLSEHKGKTKQPMQQERIDSPLAKYNDLGQLTCILCKAVVRSESVWKVHINSKSHRENIDAAKQLKKQFAINLEPSKKRPAENKPKEEFPEKRKNLSNNKSIEKDVNAGIPSDFFDSKGLKSYFKTTLEETSIKADLINVKRNSCKNNDPKNVQGDIKAGENSDDQLPEGFFDDPVKDAKIRNQEYKDPLDEEWDKFQKEIKEESTVSNAIISEEQDEATTKRQIEEIDEQIRKWNRVLDLEKRKESVVKQKKTTNRMVVDESDSNETYSSDDDSSEFLDWRSKRSDRTNS